MRLIERRVKRVVIGMLDPNPAICGKGERFLRDHGIVVDRSQHDLIVQLEELNRDFTRAQSRRAENRIPPTTTTARPPLSGPAKASATQEDQPASQGIAAITSEVVPPAPKHTEYQRRVIDRLAKLSEDLYSEFNPASEDYLTGHHGLKEALQLIHSDFERSKAAILAPR
jgi:hypothetical protein